MKLSGYICARNALELDYCLEIGARSLLPVVDELILCDSDSTDGTRELMLRLAAEDDRVRVINRPWSDPRGDLTWWTDWLNFAREQCSHPMQITLDADEVLDDSEECHAAVRETVAAGAVRQARRLNYWKDPHHLVPDGKCCGCLVARLGPTRYWMPSDEPHPEGGIPMVEEAAPDKRFVIHHLGFLRRTEAFFKKSRVVQRAFFNDYDGRLARAEESGQTLWDVDVDYNEKLVPYAGPWPEAVKGWLLERGFEI